MKGRFSIFILFAALFLAYSCGDKEPTPFDGFVGKPYGNYHYALRDTMRVIYATDDEVAIAKAVAQMRALPDRLHDRQWNLEADFLRLNFYHDYRSGDDQAFVKDLLDLKDDALKAGNRVFAIRITRRLMDLYVEKGDALNQMRYACMLENESEDISVEEFPDVLDNAFRMAMVFSRFHCYDKARANLDFMLSHEPVPEIELAFLGARNRLGIFLRETDLDRSDSVFMTLVTDTTIIDKEVWKGIGLGNLGANSVMKGDFAQAAVQVEESYKIMSALEDSVYCFNLATQMISVYCHLGQAGKARAWAAEARRLEKITRPEDTDFRSELYHGLSDLEAMSGNFELARTYTDSLVEASLMSYEYWPPTFVSDIEMSLAQEKLMAERQVSKVRLSMLKLLVVLFVIACVFLGRMIFLNIKNRKLIRNLSAKARTWAVESTDGQEDASEHLQCILEYLEKSEAYLDPACSIDSVSKAVGLNRSYVSKAVNDKYDNFKSLLNNYRIKRALKLYEANKSITVAELSQASGFGSTGSFYTSFASVTGVSFSDYRRLGDPAE